MDIIVIGTAFMTALITTAVAFVFGLPRFLIESIIHQNLEKEVEQFRAQLQTKYETQLERFKVDLQLSRFEHETRFAKLHERRAEVIAELYKRLVHVQKTFEEMVVQIESVGESKRAEILKTAQQNADAFLTYFDENQIYLDDYLCMKMRNFSSMLREVYAQTFVAQTAGADRLFKLTAQQDTWRKIRVEIPELRKDIERGFRKMLGGTSSSSDNMGTNKSGQLTKE